MKRQNLTEKITIPEGIKVEVNGNFLRFEGLKGRMEKKLFHPSVKIEVTGSEIIVFCKNSTKKEKKLIYSFIAHINNCIRGVQNPFVYKLKICSGPPKSHFPAKVLVTNNVLSVKNFLGEKIPRELKLRDSVKVKVEGDDITVESSDIEAAGNTASDIELLTRITKRDRRIFQDGIYITEKPKGVVEAQ